MSPQEYGARINLGLAQLARDAISMETFRRDYAKVSNPRAENRKVISEKVYTSEDVIKALIPLALHQEGLVDLQKIWEQTQNPTPPPGMTPPQARSVGLQVCPRCSSDAPRSARDGQYAWDARIATKPGDATSVEQRARSYGPPVSPPRTTRYAQWWCYWGPGHGWNPTNSRHNGSGTTDATLLPTTVNRL
jgi:hypothetical protein